MMIETIARCQPRGGKRSLERQLRFDPLRRLWFNRGAWRDGRWCHGDL